MRHLKTVWLGCLLGSLLQTALLRADEQPENPPAELPKPTTSEPTPPTQPTPEQPATPEEPAPTEPADPALMNEWKILNDRRVEIGTELKKLQRDFFTAGISQRQAINDQMEALIAEFNTQLLPKMNELAPRVYAQDPKNLAAGEFVLQQAWTKDDHAKVVEIGQKLLDAGRKTVPVLSALGVAYFKLEQFEKSFEVLEQAEQLGRLNPEAASYSLYAETYAETAPEEMALREKEAAYEGDQKLPHVLFTTNKGEVELELFEDHAPNAVANFIDLVESGQYNGIRWHRVVPGFIVQSGNLASKEWDPKLNYTTGSPGFTIKSEFDKPNARKHFKGSLSMANAGKDTGSSQFFITLTPTPELNAGARTPTSGHTVFGRVVRGMEVVEKLEVGDQIQTAKVLNKRPHEYKPVRTEVPKVAPTATPGHP